ncbi:MAG TPA: RHS repeat-associated core domain-containing protein, partial [Tepidisphaeraceae bacterium]|nr:RHS repeat-associated core domain-containing protein [Tepidisphaeraceae bacterium]
MTNYPKWRNRPAGVDAVMAQEASGAVTWMADDKEGTPRDVVNNSGSVVNHMVFKAFGQDVYESNSSYARWNSFGGSHEDIYTSLNLNGRRWDDPATAKWLSQDPSDFSAGDPDLSRVVLNDPTNLIDPSGLAPESYLSAVVVSHFESGTIADVYTQLPDKDPVLALHWDASVGRIAQMKAVLTSLQSGGVQLVLTGD